MVTFDDRVDPGYPGDAQTSLFGRDPDPTGAGEATGDGEARGSVPAPDGGVQATEALPDLAYGPFGSDWQEFDHDGRRWRHRLHHDRVHTHTLRRGRAPGEHTWELEKLVDGEWRSVRYYQRRDEIWTHITGESPGGD